LFYEEVNYAASGAFQRVSGDDHAFRDSLGARGPVDRLAIMGKEFDFYDNQEMRRRLPGSQRAAWVLSLRTEDHQWPTEGE